MIKKNNYDQKIKHKIKKGKKLSGEELQYIRIHYPEIYPQIVRIQVQRKALERQLKMQIVLVSFIRHEKI